MANESRRSIHQTLSFGEHQDGGFSICNACGSKTMLIFAGSCWWSVDSEAFKAGEPSEDAPDCVEIGEEITAHYCDKCGEITSLSLNT